MAAPLSGSGLWGPQGVWLVKTLGIQSRHQGFVL